MSNILRYRNILMFSLVASVAAGPGSTALEGRDSRDSGSDTTVSVLTLAEARERALEENRSLASARASAEAAAARARAASAFLWPSLGVEAGWVRSDDPVAAFGTRLRQARFTEADFALDALNRPEAVEDWSAGAGIRWAGVDPSAWAGRDAAEAGARAAELGTERTREAVVFRTEVLYLDAVAAQARLRAAETAESAAASTLATTTSRRDEGLLTDADVLQARAALEDHRARVVDARRAVTDARARLAHHLGLPPGSGVVPADTLPPVGGAAAAESASLEERPDLAASRAGVEAREARIRAARAARLPTLEAFGQLSSHAPDPLDGREANVTVGVQLRLPVFTGGRLGAAEDEARAEARAARIEHEDRLATARREIRQLERAVEAAGQGAEAAAAAARAAEEAHRLMEQRFREGMTTTTELLQAEARASRLRTAAVDARIRALQARAALAFARPTPPTSRPEDPR